MTIETKDMHYFASRIRPGTRSLIAGASGGIGCETMRLFARNDAVIGAHYNENQEPLRRLIRDHSLESARIQFFQEELTADGAAERLVEAFVAWAGGIDVLVQLVGGVSRPASWDELTAENWRQDIELNLTVPFLLARSAMLHMKSGGGRIVLMGTASATHGGGPMTMAYGVAKSGIECLTKGLARQGAPYGILVNAICPGFIETQFYSRWLHRSPEDIEERVGLVPVKRAGTAMEVAGAIAFLASPFGNFITGECLTISGGDWL